MKLKIVLEFPYARYGSKIESPILDYDEGEYEAVKQLLENFSNLSYFTMPVENSEDYFTEQIESKKRSRTHVYIPQDLLQNCIGYITMFDKEDDLEKKEDVNENLAGK